MAVFTRTWIDNLVAVFVVEPLTVTKMEVTIVN